MTNPLDNLRSTEARLAFTFILAWAQSEHAEKRTDEILFFNASREPIAAISRKGLFLAARRNGAKRKGRKIWFSYAPESLESQFALTAVRYSERDEVCKEVIRQVYGTGSII